MQLRATKAELSSREAKLPEIVAARDAAVAELEQTKALLAERDEALARVESAQAAADDTVLEIKAEYEEKLAELVASLAEATAAAAPWASAERHLLFFQGREGYELVERAGPPPAAGDRVDVPGGTHLVARIAASPAPGPRLPCAYLIAA